MPYIYMYIKKEMQDRLKKLFSTSFKIDSISTSRSAGKGKGEERQGESDRAQPTEGSKCLSLQRNPRRRQAFHENPSRSQQDLFKNSEALRA